VDYALFLVCRDMCKTCRTSGNKCFVVLEKRNKIKNYESNKFALFSFLPSPFSSIMSQEPPPSYNEIVPVSLQDQVLQHVEEVNTADAEWVDAIKVKIKESIEQKTFKVVGEKTIAFNIPCHEVPTSADKENVVSWLEYEILTKYQVVDWKFLALTNLKTGESKRGLHIVLEKREEPVPPIQCNQQ
jgi:hypothetical protein